MSNLVIQDCKTAAVAPEKARCVWWVMLAGDRIAIITSLERMLVSHASARDPGILTTHWRRGWRPGSMTGR